jgi:acyl-coenzyme A thioesterase PaaI-like protein
MGPVAVLAPNLGSDTTLVGSSAHKVTDDTMGPAILIMTGAKRHPTTIAMNVTFLAPARPGGLFGEATMLQLGKTIGFVEAILTDIAGVVIARATSSVRLRAMESVGV